MDNSNHYLEHFYIKSSKNHFLFILYNRPTEEVNYFKGTFKTASVWTIVLKTHNIGKVIDLSEF